jgi:hypothetical protein
MSYRFNDSKIDRCKAKQHQKLDSRVLETKFLKKLGFLHH